MNKIKGQSASADSPGKKQLSVQVFTGRNMNDITGGKGLGGLGWRKRSPGLMEKKIFLLIVQQAGNNVTHSSLHTACIKGHSVI